MRPEYVYFLPRPSVDLSVVQYVDHTQGQCVTSSVCARTDKQDGFIPQNPVRRNVVRILEKLVIDSAMGVIRERLWIFFNLTDLFFEYLERHVSVAPKNKRQGMYVGELRKFLSLRKNSGDAFRDRMYDISKEGKVLHGRNHRKGAM